MERYAFPRIGRRPVSEVNTTDVLEILTPIWHVKAETARAVRQRIRSVLEWAIAMDLRNDNPCDRVLPVLGPQNDIVTHRQALPHKDVAAAIETVRASGSTQPAVRLAFEFLVLTAARSGEVRLATWDEIDTAGAVWTISAARMKAKREHRVPLCGGRWRFSTRRGRSATAIRWCSPCGAGGRYRVDAAQDAPVSTGSPLLPTASARRSGTGQPKRPTIRARSSRRRSRTSSRTRSMGWTPPPDGIAMCQGGCAVTQLTWRRRHPMEHATIIGIDLAKHSFQVHGARADGSVAFRKKLSRARVLDFVASHPRCVVAMEACASAHHWGREIGKLGHAVKLVPPIYVKPFVKRQKNDAADAEAICEAVSRPTMRFVAVKTQAQQARGMLFRTRELLVRQRTQTINALRGHVAEFGVVAPRGPAHVGRLAGAIEDAESGLPAPVRELGALLLGQVAALDEKIAGLEQELRERAREDEQTVRLMRVPGIGPLTAMAIQAFAPPMESFRRGRDFSAWRGLVPRQHATGGKPRLGKISKMGQRDLRRLLVVGAMTRVNWAVRRGTTKDPWLARMLARKPRMLVAVALANRMARIAWALMTKNEDYRARAVTA